MAYGDSEHVTRHKIDLTEAEVEALRFLRDFNEIDATELYEDWEGYFRRIDAFPPLHKHSLVSWRGGYPGQWGLTPKGRALVEILDGSK